MRTEDMARILAIDDEKSILESYQMALEDFHQVEFAENGEDGLRSLDESSFDVVLLDISMPGLSGLDVLKEIKRQDHDCSIIMVTVYKDVETIVEAMKSGADDYLTKPFKVTELRHAVDRAFKVIELERKNRSLEASLMATEHRQEIVYLSRSMDEVFQDLRKSAVSDSSIFLLGESGTGKELAAHFVHEYSDRSDGPIVTVNCAAIPDTLLESELFGHEKGAFSGASERKIGKFELAHMGTIFLDEIGLLPMDLQAKLLRTIETKVIERVGGTKPIHLDVRWLAATNRDPAALVEEGVFREDLFFRLNVISMSLPPLRDRLDDLPLLANHFLEQFGRDMKKPPLTLNEEILEVFQVYSWPGNVRELRNLIERLMVLEPGPEVSVEQLPTRMLEAYSEAVGVDITDVTDSRYKEAIEEFRRNFIIRAMRTANGNQTHAARSLGLHRNTLIHHLREMHIEPGEYGP
ncbi:sigma-54-dependent transcriptional regulator [Gemmatimonadota bacterium]